MSGEVRGQTGGLIAGLTLAFLLTLVPLAGQGEPVNARLSPPGPDGTLELILEAERAPLAEPDLSALAQDFEVLGSRNQHQSFMVNGRRTDSFGLILTLRPRREGVTEVPSITYGEVTTPPLPIGAAASPGPPQAPAQKWVPAPMPAQMPATMPPQIEPTRPQTGGAATLLVEVEVAPETVRVKEQAVLTARVLAPRSAAGTMARPRLYDPKVAGATLVPLGEDDYQASRAGTPHEVYERRYALFPTQAGTLEIEPLVADAWVGGPGVAAPAQQRASSPALSLRVEPAPDDTGGRAWLPARTVTLTEDQPGLARVRPGETWQRFITLRVQGQPASALPQLSASAPFQLSTRNATPRLWDERLPDGLVGIRREALLISGSESGLYRLPEVQLDWWNTATGTWETAVLPARDLEIVAAAAPIPPLADTARPLDQREPFVDPAQGQASATPPGARPGAAPLAPRRTGSPWIWALIAIGLGWLILHALRRHRRPAARGPAVTPARAAEPESRPDPLGQATAAVRDAYEGGNPEAARHALLAWARLAWPHSPPGNLTQLALRCPEPTRARIMLLDQAFFSPEPVRWSHEPLWDELAPVAAAAAQEPPPPPPKRRLGTPQPRRT